MRKRLKNTNLFTVKELRNLADLIEVEGVVIYRLMDHKSLYT
ncbi:MAG: hypothetical protein P0Y53_15865 [Candidatus Pseudobacter hemicellulosilyticus]|uniref:Uncharacterized protein n=1 Tax=Candidatus Pseudobacter hemicellulosilyticus TaxID=3121375 RepID=A0AAJ6BDT6_9BACT|nr:MAG: hypothetical protein P0Y53_15865 [Pseudobacter sp.]